MRYITTIIAVLITLTGFSQKAPTVRTKLAVDTIQIGDQTKMEVDITKDISTDILVPQFENGKVSPHIEIIGSPIVDTLKRDNRNLYLRLIYTITSFEAGVHNVGGFPIVYTHKNGQDTVIAPDMMKLVVLTYEIDTTTQQIIDIKAPIDTPLQWAEIKELVLYSALGALLLAAVLYFVLRHLKNRKKLPTPAIPDEPLHILAIKNLEQLHSENLPGKGQYKEYYSRLTDTLRTYLNGRYGIWAMEMTTPQIINSIKEINDPNEIKKLEELFSLADLVKFAKHTPVTTECDKSMQTAHEYIEKTQPTEEPPNTPDDDDPLEDETAVSPNNTKNNA